MARVRMLDVVRDPMPHPAPHLHHMLLQKDAWDRIVIRRLGHEVLA